jgi:uncharacterized protein (UPF0297 family)
MPKYENDKTITFSIREEEKDRDRRAKLRAVYDALTERGYNPLIKISGYILTEDPTYITNHRNARAIMSKLDRDELLDALLKEYINI